jgi:type IV pilus biogenesis protein CpaD/CtpE
LAAARPPETVVEDNTTDRRAPKLSCRVASTLTVQIAQPEDFQTPDALSWCDFDHRPSVRAGGTG